MDYKEAYEDMVKISESLKNFSNPEARREYLQLQILNSINFLRADIKELADIQRKKWF